MSAAANQGDSVGAPKATLPFRPLLRMFALGGLLLGGLLVGPGARAGSLYRCVGRGGETVFSSSAAGYKSCHRLSVAGLRAPPRHRARPASLAKIEGSVRTTARVPSFDEVAASVQTTARAFDPLALERQFAQVRGSVQTSAQRIETVTIPVVTGGRGAWSYQESRGGAAPMVAGSGGGRVLRGAVYRVRRRDGSVEYTNLPQANQRGSAVKLLFSYIATCMACNLHSPINWDRVRLNFEAYASTIHAASLEFGVDEAFLRAIIHAESAFNARAMSIKGAQGLMQLMPATASDMGVLDAFDADQNIRGGARYLALLLHNFAGNERLAAAAYNAGPAAVQRYRGVPPYAETQVYVDRVGALRRRYTDAAHPPLAALRNIAGQGVTHL